MCPEYPINPNYACDMKCGMLHVLVLFSLYENHKALLTKDINVIDFMRSTAVCDSAPHVLLYAKPSMDIYVLDVTDRKSPTLLELGSCPDGVRAYI